MRQNLVKPTPNLAFRPHSAKPFPAALLSSSTRRREAACCPNRRLISMLGLMELVSQDFAQVYIALELERKRKQATPLSPPKTYAKVREVETSPTGSRTMHVRRRRDA